MINNILFVDDEIHILKAIKRGLRDENFNKFYASSGSDAIDILKTEDIHVIVTDMKMPQMTGLELLTYVKENHPDVVKVILSGYTQLQQILVTINRIDIYKFLTKPFDIRDEFKSVLYSSIEQYNTKMENKVLKESLEKKNEVYQKMIQTNSEKVDIIKKDFSLINKFTFVIGKYIYNLGVKLNNQEISIEKYDVEMDFLLSIENKFLMMMPMYYKEFSLNEYQNEIEKYLINHSGLKDRSPEIFLLGGFEGKLYGNLALLYFSVTKLLTNYFINQVDMSYSFFVSIIGKCDNQNIEIVISSSENIITEDEIRIKTLEVFFYTIFKFFEGSFNLDRDNKKIIVRLPIKKMK
jgi:CheY-like chemotaxis protein